MTSSRLPSPDSGAEAATTDEGAAARIRLGRSRIVWAGRSLWFRTYTVGGYDGYRTISGRYLPCGEVERLWKEDHHA